MRILVYLLLAVVIALPAVSQERKLALLVGNQEYPDQIGDLATPHLDVTTLAAALDASGFETHTHFDLERGDMLAAIKAFRDELAEAKLEGGKVFGVVYFAGQGFSVGDVMGDQNLLVASRQHVWSSDDLMQQTVSFEDAVSSLLGAAPDVLYVIGDSVREGLQLGFSDETRKTGFVPYPAQPGLLVAYSAAPGERAPDDGEFAKTLAREIVVPGQLASVAVNNALAAVAESQPSRGAPFIDMGRMDAPVCFNGCPPGEDAGAEPEDTAGESDEEEIDLANMRPPTTSTDLMTPNVPQVPVQLLASLATGDEGARAAAALDVAGASAGPPAPGGTSGPAGTGAAPVVRPAIPQPAIQQPAAPSVAETGMQAVSSVSSSPGPGLLGSVANVGAGVTGTAAGAVAGVATGAAQTAVNTQIAAVQAVQTQAMIGASSAAAGIATNMATSGMKAGANVAGAGVQAGLSVLTGGGPRPDVPPVRQASPALRQTSRPPVRPAAVNAVPPARQAPMPSPSPVASSSVAPTLMPSSAGAASGAPTADSIRQAFEESRLSSEAAAEQIADAEAEASTEAAKAKAGKAVPTRRPRPAYPEEALAQEIEGYCDVKFDLDVEGVPFNISAACTDSIFERESVRAVKNARFEPTVVDGMPAIRKGVTYPLEYQLN